MDSDIIFYAIIVLYLQYSPSHPYISKKIVLYEWNIQVKWKWPETEYTKVIKQMDKMQQKVIGDISFKWWSGQ